MQTSLDSSLFFESVLLLVFCYFVRAVLFLCFPSYFCFFVVFVFLFYSPLERNKKRIRAIYFYFLAYFLSDVRKSLLET